MDITIKCTAVAIMTAVSCLLVRRSNPEIALVISIAAVAVLYIAAFDAVGEIRQVFIAAKDTFGISPDLIRPVLKCMGIAVVCTFGADLCRDAAQSALASAVEAVGTLFAAATAMPMIMDMIRMLGDII